MTDKNNEKTKMSLDEYPFPKTKIDYTNDSTMQSLKKLKKELKRLKDRYQD